MRGEVELLTSEGGAKPTEAANHLVAHGENVVLGAHCGDLFEIFLRRHDHAAGPHHRFGDESRDRVGTFFQDQRFQFVRKARRERFLGFTFLSEPVVVRTGGVQKTRKRQIEITMVRR